MATVVQIELTVDEKGAVQGIRNFGSSAMGLDGTLKSLDLTLKQLNEHLSQIGSQGTSGIRRVTNEADGMHKKFQTSFDTVRLLRTELGVQVPRAMESIIARNQVLMASISKISSLMVGIGAGMIAFSFGKEIFDGVKDIYEKFLDVNKAVDEYMQKAGDAANQKLFDTASLETANDLLREANRQIDTLNQKKADSLGPLAFGAAVSSGVYAPGQDGPMPFTMFTTGDDKRLAQAYADQTAAKSRVDELNKQSDLKGIEAQNQYASAVARPWQKSNVEMQNAIRLAKKHLEITQADEKALHDATQAARLREDADDKKPVDERTPVHEIDPNRGKAEYDQEIASARLQAQAESINYRRSLNEELIALDNQAREAELSGIAQLEAEREAADAAFARNHGLKLSQMAHWDQQYRNGVLAIDQKFYADEKKLRDEQERQTEQLQGQAALAGFKGIGKIQGQGDLDIANVRGDKSLTEEQKDERVAAIRLRVLNEILEAESTYNDQIDALADETTEHQLSGFAKIQAAAQRAIAEKERAFHDQWDQADLSNPDVAKAHSQAQDQLNRAKGLIQSGASFDSAELERRNRDEISQMEAEARIRSLSAERQQTAAITAEYDERLRKFQEDRDAQLVGLKEGTAQFEEVWDEYNRRVVASEELKDAELVEAAHRMREKMAGEFTNLFHGLDHPLNELKDMGERVAGQVAGALAQRVQNTYSQKHPGAQSQGSPWDRALDRIAGTSDLERKETVGRDDHAHGTMAVNQAHIQVSSATVMLSGMTGGSMPGSPASFSGARVTGDGVVSSFDSFGNYIGAPSATYDLGTNAIGTGGSSTATMGTVGAMMPSAPLPSNRANAAISNVNQGMSLFQQARGIFGGKAKGISGSPSGDDSLDTTDAGGPSSIAIPGTQNFDVSQLDQKMPGNGSMVSSGFNMGNVGGAASGAIGLYSAYEGNGGVGGAASGAMSGMELGMMVAGPIGAAVGAAAGAIIGAIGFGGREKARVYDLKQVRPHIAQDMQSLGTGGDYLTLYGDLQTLDTTAERTTKQWGPGAHSYYNDTIRPEIAQARGRLDAMERGGRTEATGAQFATGTDFVPYTGSYTLHRGESVFQPTQTERATRALERGADLESISRDYRMAMQSSSARSSSMRGGDTHHYYINAIDVKSFDQALMNHKHTIRAAQNASYAENSGGSDAGF